MGWYQRRVHGGIIGGAVAGVAVFLVIAGVLFFMFLKKKKPQKSSASNSTSQASSVEIELASGEFSVESPMANISRSVSSTSRVQKKNSKQSPQQKPKLKPLSPRVVEKSVDETEPGDIKVHVDPVSGRRYSHNSTTAETKWLPKQKQRKAKKNWGKLRMNVKATAAFAKPANSPRDVKNQTTKPGDTKVHVDPVSGRRFSYNSTTCESRWL